jgi:FkbM family methyltransferase
VLAGVHNLLRLLGVDVVRYPGNAHRFPEAERQQLLQSVSASLILDVGANSGQFARQMRRDGFAGRIVSFEPLDAPFNELSRWAGRDPLWEVHRTAIGLQPGTAVMHVTSDSWSSSLLPVLDRHAKAASISVVGQAAVPVASLDDLAAEADWADHVSYLKIDVQGGELDVLRGAERLLSGTVAAVEIEVSLVELYRGQPLFSEVNTYMGERGFCPVRIEPEFFDPDTGSLLQLNATYKSTAR